MKTPALVFLLLTSLVFAPANSQAGARDQVLRVAVGLVTGAGAATAMAQTGTAVLDYQEGLAALQRQGCDVTNAAVYSLYFTLNNDASAVYWADLIGRPDVFAVVSIEGEGDFLLPDITNGYGGQPLLRNVVAKRARPGKRVVINFYDDDSASNAVWNSILSTRIPYTLTANVTALQAVLLEARSTGSFQLLDRPVTIDGPDIIATAEFQVPRFSFSDTWVAQGHITNASGATVGELQFSRLWNSQIDPPGATKDALQRIIFWGALSVFLSIAAIRLLCFSPKSKSKVA